MILVIWKYAQMHQNTFWTTSDIKNIFFQAMILVVWKYAQMHQNIFLTTSDLKNIFFRPWFWWSGSLRKCIKTRYEPLQILKISFFHAMNLMVWKYAQMHQNTFLTTSDLNFFFHSMILVVCATFSDLKIFIFQAMILMVWEYAQMQ
jgi:hypothetical protein